MLFSVDLVLERFGGLEYGSVACRDINSRTVSRVAALTRVTVLAGEGAEASQGNGIMGCQGIHDRVEHAVHNSSSILLGQFILSSYFFNQFGLVPSHNLLHKNVGAYLLYTF